MRQTLLTTKAVSEFDDEAVLALSEFNAEPKWMRQSRLDALRIFRDIPKPTTKDEPWRRTDIRRLKPGPGQFRPLAARKSSSCLPA